MVWRSITTLGIWGIIAVLAGVLTNTVRYPVSTIVNLEEMGGEGLFSPIYNTTYETMPQVWQFTVGMLLLALLVAATFATIAIWRGAVTGGESSQVSARINTGIASAKQKRDQQARLKRLLDSMDEREVADALGALEMNRAGDHLGDDGEQMSVGELLAQSRRGN